MDSVVAVIVIFGIVITIVGCSQLNCYIERLRNRRRLAKEEKEQENEDESSKH